MPLLRSASTTSSRLLGVCETMKKYEVFASMKLLEGSLHVVEEEILDSRLNVSSNSSGTKYFLFESQVHRIFVEDLSGLAGLFEFLSLEVVELVGRSPEAFCNLVAGFSISRWSLVINDSSSSVLTVKHYKNPMTTVVAPPEVFGNHIDFFILRFPGRAKLGVIEKVRFDMSTLSILDIQEVD